MNSDTHFDRLARHGGEMCSCGASFIALFALATCVFDQWRVSAFGPEYVPMAPSTALLLLLLSGAVFLRGRWPAAAATNRFGYAAVIVVALFSLLVWVEFLLGVEPPIENWLARTTARVGKAPVSHMSLAAATVFLMVALALLFELPPFSRRKWFRYVAAALSLAVVWIGLAVLAAYTAGAPLFYGSGVVPTALLTSVTIILMGVGTIVTSGSDSLLLRMFVRDPLHAPPTRPGNFEWGLPAGLRGRLLLLGVITCVAGTGLMGWMAVERYAAAEAEITRNTLNLTHMAARQLERLLEGDRYLLISLAKVPAIRNLDAAASSALLAAIKQELPLYANFSVFKADGEAFASALPLTQSINSAALPWFQRAVHTRGFTVGEFQIGRISGKQVLGAAYPVLDDAGQVRAVLNSALNLTAVNAIIKPAQLPPEASLVVIDRKGTVLARYPEPERWVGRAMTEADSVKTILVRQQGTAEVAGADGVKRICSFVPVAGADNGLFVSIGIPKQVALAGIRRVCIQEVFALGLIAGFAMLMVMRHTFDDMAGALERREAERERAEEALRRSEEWFRSLFENMLEGLAHCRMIFDNEDRPADFVYLNVNGSFERLTGLKNVVGKKETEIFPGIKELHPEIFEIFGRVALTGKPETFEIDFKPLKLVFVLSVYSIEKGYCVLTFDNITERKRAEEELQFRNVLLSTQQEASLDGILVVDENARILSYNRRFVEMWGLPAKLVEDGLNEPVLQFVAAQVAEPRSFVQRVEYLYEHRQETCQDALILADGRVFDRYSAPMFGPDERYYGRVWYFRDITKRKQAEEEARASEERYGMLFREMQNGFAHNEIICDSQGRPINSRYLAINPAFERITGRKAEEVVGKTILEVFPTLEPNWIETFGRVALTGEPAHFESSAAELGVCFEVSAFRPAPNQYACTFSDVTARKQAEEDIREVNEELRMVNRIISAITGVLNLHEILDRVLDEALGIVGLEGGTICLVTPGETLALATHRATSEATIQDLSTNEVKVGDCLCGECARTRCPLILHNRAEILEFSTRESTRGELIQFHAAFPLVTAGKCVGVLCVFTRTDKKPPERRLKLLETVTAQAALAIQNARLYETTQHHAGELEQRVQQRTSEFKAMALRQQALAEIELAINQPHELRAVLDHIVQHVTRLLPASGGASVILWNEAQQRFDLNATTVPRQSGQEAVQRIRQCGGATRWIIDHRQPLIVPDVRNDPLGANPMLAEFELQAYAGLPLCDDSGVLGVLYAMSREPCDFTSADRDFLEAMAARGAAAITKVRLYESLAEAKDRAEAADRLKSAFLATMSHELRTPLNSIIGFTGLLLQGLAGPLNAEQTKQLRMVKDSGQHLLALINDVLDISKIEAGQIEIASAPFDLRAALNRVMQIVMPLADKKQLPLIVQVARAVGQITSDRRRVEQVLLNLLSNAIKFTEKGEVTLTAEIVPGTRHIAQSAVRISVADTGIGIKPEDMDKLFQPFRQLDAGLTRQHEGTGLGLAICKRLVERLGGTIALESDWGKGSTFDVTLPIHPEEKT